MAEYIKFWEYITSEGERWDTIAYKFYGDATKYEPIIVANPYIKIEPILPAGLKLQIPVIDSNQNISTERIPLWLK